MRDSLWFLPAVLCVLAAALAETLIVVDRRVDEIELGPFAVLATRIGEAGSRDVLGAIASSVLGVAATSFSITIAVLATASSTYGPRLVRNFMTDRGNQFVLGVYSATFLYCLLTLRSIRETDSADEVFVPHLAVNVAVLLAVLSIGVLVWFINHIADSVQVGTLARKVRAELVETVDRLYPEQLGQSPSEVPEAAGAQDVPSGLRSDGVGVRADGIGYVQGVTEDRLLDLAARHDVVVSLVVRPGSHVVVGTVVALVWPSDRVDDDLVAAVRDCVSTGPARSPDQDVDYAVLVLEEMAVRALSPGTNDPYTALNALDDLAAGLTRLVGRDVPSPYRYGPDDRLRVVAPRSGKAEMVDRVFDAIRLHATGHPTVLHRMCALAEQLARASDDPGLDSRLVAHLERLLEAFERSSPQQCDVAELRRRVAAAVAVVRSDDVAATGPT